MKKGEKSGMDAIFSADALSPREQVTEWVTLKEKLGTKVGGRWIGYWNVPAQGVFKAQLGAALQDIDDPTKVYGVNLSEYFRDQISEFQVGDLVGFEYYKDIPAKTAGLSATKAIRAYNADNVKRKLAGEAPVITAAADSCFGPDVDPNDIPFE